MLPISELLCKRSCLGCPVASQPEEVDPLAANVRSQSWRWLNDTVVGRGVDPRSDAQGLGEEVARVVGCMEGSTPEASHPDVVRAAEALGIVLRGDCPNYGFEGRDFIIKNQE